MTDDGTCGCSDDPGGPIDPGLDGQDDPTAETGLSVQVQHLEGQVDATGGEMTGLSAHVALHGGADAINMLDVTVHISGMDNEPGGAKGFGSDFVHHAAPNPGGHPTYNITEVTDPLDSYQEGSEYLLDTESTLRMDFDIGGVLSDGLSPGSGVTLEFMISGGVYTTTESATTPGEYDAGAVYILK